MDQYNDITKDNIDHLLFELARNYKKSAGRKAICDLYIVGGAAIIQRHDFRNTSEDIDSIINGQDAFKEAVVKTASENNLPYNWINNDFMKTSSYSPKITKYCNFYKKYANCLNVFVIDDMHLLAMKLESFRSYKNDKSDIVGLLYSISTKADISFEKIQKAYNDLYENKTMKDEAVEFLKTALDNKNYLKMYQSVKEEEKSTREIVRKSISDLKNDSKAKALSSAEEIVFYSKLKALGINNSGNVKNDAGDAYKKLIMKHFEENVNMKFEDFEKDFFGPAYNFYSKNLTDNQEHKKK